MTEMIKFGIDLGTTNSLVAKFNKGTVEVFKNPSGFKETLPSAVGFRNDRILVGDQARAYSERDARNVKFQFKRRMGTTESFRIESLGQSKTPVELSAFVLKDLKRFIHTGEVPEAMVITIPASFDMVQCNATKEAGYAAGFKQVVLLQEPIAASLAYANKEKNIDLRNTQWIVYDLGGGTFDVALVRIVEGELKIVDHEGDNYLGGADFDELIVKKLVVPELEKRGRFTDLLAQMTSESGRYNRLWYSLLHSAEEAKIELSTSSSAEIDLSRSSIEDEDGRVIDDYITITRSEYEALIKDTIDKTADMLKKILTRNSLRPQDLKFVLMVGGSTYTPFVRKRIEELLGIPANTGINPTNAIAIGAAYFAGSKEIDLAEKPEKKMGKSGVRNVKVSYSRASQEQEELFAARIEGEVAGFFYRIIRQDGGYDSGIKQLSARINEDLPLLKDAHNLFSFTIYDSHNNPVPADFSSIEITHGIHPCAGQMLPADMSLVIDDLNTHETKLERIFAKNTVLPSKISKTVDVNRTIISGSVDELIIMVVEGPSDNHFMANKTIGRLTIRGKELKRDILRGTEVDLTFELSESRDLSITAYINPSGPEFSSIFSPTFREVDVEALSLEVQRLEASLNEEKADALESEKYEVVEKLEKLSGTVQELRGKAMLLSLTPDDVTDDRYKLDDRKREVAQELSRLTSGKRIEHLRAEYQTARDEVASIVNESGNDHERQQLHEIIVREHVFLTSTNLQKIEDEITQLHRISFQILRRTPDFLIAWFESLLSRRETFNDQIQAKHLIEAGRQHVAAQDYDKLGEVNGRLHSLLPQKEQDSQEMQGYTGIYLR